MEQLRKKLSKYYKRTRNKIVRKRKKNWKLQWYLKLIYKRKEK